MLTEFRKSAVPTSVPETPPMPSQSEKIRPPQGAAFWASFTDFAGRCKEHLPPKMMGGIKQWREGSRHDVAVGLAENRSSSPAVAGSGERVKLARCDFVQNANPCYEKPHYWHLGEVPVMVMLPRQ
jgi:hypothetical protein